MFLEEVERTARIVKALIKGKKVKVISQFDCNGLSTLSILSKMLLRENVNFEIRVVKQLTSNVINALEVSANDFLIFSDCGSGQLLSLKDIIEKTHVLVLDHHEPVNFHHLNLFHINPLLFGEEELSSSIVAYLLAKFVNIRNVDLVDLAVVGAVADVVEEKWEFKGLAKKILEEAEALNKISVTKGLRLYGRNFRPIYQSLAYSFDPFIPGISGSESHAVQFLSDLGIAVKSGDEWKKLKDLTLEEQQKLASEIIRKRIGMEEPAEDIFGDIYIILGRPEELQDAREFSTLINACGRMGNASFGIRLCLGDYSILESVMEIFSHYRKRIYDILNLIKENKILIHRSDFANYILAGNNIPDVLIGTITSIALNSNLVETKPLFGLSDSENGFVKVSARLPRSSKINLREVLVKAVEEIDEAEAGGHALAAGCFIPKGKEEDFIKIVDRILGDLIGSKKS